MGEEINSIMKICEKEHTSGIVLKFWENTIFKRIQVLIVHFYEREQVHKGRKN